MILFINLCDKFLTKAEKKAQIISFLGVKMAPTPNENKSLEVSGLYYGRLLSYIKFYIDEAIAEMENQQDPTQQETEDVAFQTQELQATKPVAIKIQGDHLDTFTDILETSTTGLDFKRTEDKVVVGIFRKEIFGVYGIKDSEIWMEYRLTEYLEAVHSIDFDKILEGTDIEITITDGCTQQQQQTDYTEVETEAIAAITKIQQIRGL